MKVIERNFKKNPHTANFLMTFHSGGGKNLGGGVLPSDIDPLDLVPAQAPAYKPSPAQGDLIAKLILEITELNIETGTCVYTRNAENRRLRQERANG